MIVLIITWGTEKELHKYYKKISSMLFFTKFLFKPDKLKSWKLVKLSFSQPFAPSGSC